MNSLQQVNNIQQQIFMNQKAKRYFQEMNKQNIAVKLTKQDKSKQIKGLHSKLALSQSKKHIEYRNNTQKKYIRESKQNVKFPKIYNLQNKENKQLKDIRQNRQHFLSRLSQISPTKNQTKSFKKLVTEPSLEHSCTRTLSPTSNDMKKIIGKIMKSKQNRHLVSIEEEIDKLDDLTKRYSFLRKDLVSIQEDILTISFKQKCKERKDSKQCQSVYL